MSEMFQPIIDVARASVPVAERITAIELADASAVVMARTGVDGGVHFASELQAAIEARLPEPRRRTGGIECQDAASFIAAVNRWKLPGRTVIYSQLTKMTLTAIFDDHLAGPIGAGWRTNGFMAGYTAPLSPEWIKWCGASGVALSQDAFADFIDTNLADVTTVPTAEKGQYPSPVELLEMARNLSIHTRGAFERKIDPTTGSGTLVIKDEHETYSSKIWRAFPVALRVFEGGTKYLVEARIRFTIVGGKAVFTYTLHRSNEIARDAFNEVRALVAKECEGCPVLAGIP